MSKPEPIPSPAIARRVRRAVNLTERSICGDGAVRAGAVAEGLALTGCRAARIFDSTGDASPASATIEAPWVDHRLRRAGPAGAGSYAFELIAGDGQEAVDHCLVAHRLATSTGLPVAALVDRELADRIELVRLPERAWIDELPAIDRSSRKEFTGWAEAQAAAFEQVSRQTGRTLRSVAAVGRAGARYVLLAAGTAGPLARETCRVLEASGIDCGAVVLSLVRPFPTAELVPILTGVEVVVVLTDGDEELAEALTHGARAAVGANTRLTMVHTSGRNAPGLGRQLGALCGFDGSALRTDTKDRVEPFVLGGLPGNSEVELRLLDSVAGLAWLGTPSVEAHPGNPGEPLTITVGGAFDDQRPLDLLFVSTPGELDGLQALERVRECGALVLDAGTEEAGEAWALLSATQRATVLRRRLRLCLIAPDARSGREFDATVLAAAADISRTVGRSGSVLEELKTVQTADAWVRAAERNLIEVDPARLPEPDPESEQEAVQVPFLPSADPSIVDPGERERLRRFHFTAGETPQEAPGPATLRPAILGAEDLREQQEPVEPTSLYVRWSRSVLGHRRKRREELAGEIGSLIDGLRRRLGLPVVTADAGLGDALGLVGEEFVDSGALLHHMSYRRGKASVDDERRQRMSSALETLERHVEHPPPLAYALVPTGSDGSIDAPDVHTVEHDDGLRAAIGLFDGLAHRAVELSRAMRFTRLMLAGSFDASIHGPVLDRLDWQSLTAEEIFRAPVVVVLETARHLRGPALAAFSELIRTGRPVHVLVDEPLSELHAETLEPPSGYHPGLGYLAVAHRESFVVQSSASRPEHIAAALERAEGSLDPVVAIVAAGERAGDAAADAAVQARATPCFVYDPSGGTTWAERFRLDGNPQPELPWPVYRVQVRDEKEQEQSLEQVFTFAHAAALDPAWRSHFLVIDRECWLEDQVELAQYLELSDRERAKKLPYILVVDGGTLRRAVVSWRLVFTSRDRARAWRILQELAGTDNAYVRRAAEEARRTAMEEADQRVAKVEADFAIALEKARGESASGTLGRLVQVLADPRGVEAALAESLSGALPPLPPPLPEGSVPPAVEAPAAAPLPAPSTTPYIDAFLCTTCNDCIDLNPRMFRYNENKQAEIADASAGTFKQLVKAAEACPARCIHPGEPRAGDKTATPALIKRAAKFA